MAMNQEKETEFRKELASLINRYSAENGSNTPDFILVDYLMACLKTFDGTVNARDRWWETNAPTDPVPAAGGAPASVDAKPRVPAQVQAFIDTLMMVRAGHNVVMTFAAAPHVVAWAKAVPMSRTEADEAIRFLEAALGEKS